MRWDCGILNGSTGLWYTSPIYFLATWYNGIFIIQSMLFRNWYLCKIMAKISRICITGKGYSNHLTDKPREIWWGDWWDMPINIGQYGVDGYFTNKGIQSSKLRQAGSSWWATQPTWINCDLPMIKLVVTHVFTNYLPNKGNSGLWGR